jgi:hypothetical protein
MHERKTTFMQHFGQKTWREEWMETAGVGIE